MYGLYYNDFEVLDMITVFIYGLDQFVVGRISRELTPNLSRIYEVEDDEVDFVAPMNMVFHDGVEQTSWNARVVVHAPMKLHILQEEVADVIFSGLKDYTINASIEFNYFHDDDRYERINPEYPRFIIEGNIVNTDDPFYEDAEDDDECDDDECQHHERKEGDEDDEIYTGNIFEDFDKLH